VKYYKVLDKYATICYDINMIGRERIASVKGWQAITPKLEPQPRMRTSPTRSKQQPKGKLTTK
jgi:hypothetical protein